MKKNIRGQFTLRYEVETASRSQGSNKKLVFFYTHQWSSPAKTFPKEQLFICTVHTPHELAAI